MRIGQYQLQLVVKRMFCSWTLFCGRIVLVLSIKMHSMVKLAKNCVLGRVFVLSHPLVIIVIPAPAFVICPLYGFIIIRIHSWLLSTSVQLCCCCVGCVYKIIVKMVNKFPFPFPEIFSFKCPTTILFVLDASTLITRG